MIAWWAVAGAADPRAACAAGDEAACVEVLVESTAWVAADALSGAPPVRVEEVLALAVRVHPVPGVGVAIVEDAEPAWFLGGRWVATATTARGAERGTTIYALLGLGGPRLAVSGATVAGPRWVVGPDGSGWWSDATWCEAHLTTADPPGLVGFVGPRCDTVLRVAAGGAELERRPRGDALEAHGDARTTWLRTPTGRLVRADDPERPSFPLGHTMTFTGVWDGLPIQAGDLRSRHGDRWVEGWCEPAGSGLACGERPIGNARAPASGPAPPLDGPRDVWVVATPGARVRAVATGQVVRRESEKKRHGFPSVVVGPPDAVAAARSWTPAPRIVGHAVADANGLARFPGLPDRVWIDGTPVPDGPGTWVVRAEPLEPVRVQVLDPDGLPVAGARVWSAADVGVTDEDGWAELDCRLTVSAAHAHRQGSGACGGGPVTLAHPRQICRARDLVFPCDELVERFPHVRFASAWVDGVHELAELVRMPGLDADAVQGGSGLPGARVIDGELWLPHGPLPAEGVPLTRSGGRAELRCLRGAIEPGGVGWVVEPCRPVARRVVVDARGRPVSVTLRAEPDLEITSGIDGSVELAPERAWRWGDIRLIADGERLTIQTVAPPPPETSIGVAGSRPARSELRGDWRSVRDGGAVVTFEGDAGRDPMGYPVRVHAFWPGGALLLHDPESHRGRRTAFSILAFATPDRAVLLEPGAQPEWVTSARSGPSRPSFRP